MLKHLLLVLSFFLSFQLNAANSVPTNISISSNSINENSLISTAVGVFSTVDSDVLDVHTYTLVSGVGSTDNASFSISGNQLISATALNFEIKNSYSIRIQSTDGNGGTYQKTFTITVNDVNENPVYNNASISIVENLGNTANVLATSASEVDAGQALVFSIVSGNTSGAFSINSTTGMISVANSTALNFEINPLFNLVIRATDNGVGALTGDAAITISLIDVNDAPVVTVPGAQVVNEFMNLNITPIVIADEDVSTDSVSASITCNNGLLTLNSTTGLRFVAGDGVSDGTIGFYGSLVDVSTALSTLVYKSFDDYVGADQVVIGIRDFKK